MKPLIIVLCWFYIAVITSCNNGNALFDQIPSSHSGVSFNNRITLNDSINPLDIVNVFNGGGVGIGDFNNDGLSDIYFTGNQVSNRLYLNKGDFVFEDITDKAGVGGMGRWGRGVSVIDINNDGLMDIYVCNAIHEDSLLRTNLLYVNRGLDEGGIPHFSESAAEYGLDIHVQSAMAAFFDCDNDGDIDMYLTVNEASVGYNPNVFGQLNRKEPNRSRGRLFQNNWDSLLQHPVFHDISDYAGITFDGYGHGATIADINADGWKDIYVTNDFISANILYINNRDGTFSDAAKNYFKHTSLYAMGQDVIDINNDGLLDIVELDMNPEDNYRKKMTLGRNNTTIYHNLDLYGTQHQYIRNTLQLNQGPRLGQNDSIGPPVFSEIGFMSGIAETDWSWATLVNDFDNDGYRDIMITNGFPKDVSDHDFIAYRDNSYGKISKMGIINSMPEVKLHNYAFKNNGDLTFRDVSVEWGLDVPAYSNGAAFADLDNNGTIDMVINNINDEALIYKNTQVHKKDAANHFLRVRFEGDQKNIGGLGTWVDIYYDNGKHQTYEHNPYRGYLSTMQPVAHFGLGNTTMVDSAVIRWPNGKKQVLISIPSDQLLKVNINDAPEQHVWTQAAFASGSLFKEVTQLYGINYSHKDILFNDFNIQNTLPHLLSEYSPALAVGDIDNNGWDDIIMGGNSFVVAKGFLQQKDGKFIQKDLIESRTGPNEEYRKDGGILLFDANGDGSLDLYIAGSGFKDGPNSSNYQDRLYINNGKTSFSLAENALPVNYTSKLCVRAADYNEDGRLDLFVSGRVYPWEYPKPVSSFIFRNDCENGLIKFTDVTAEVAPALKDIGMVCDALFTDFDNDNLTDLILVGEWMAITFLKNTGGKFENITSRSGIGDKYGWWNSIVSGDFRKTGRTDYIVGNVGSNTLYQADDEHPLYITGKDFDDNGGFESFVSLFLKDKNGKLKEFPANGRDDFLERLPSFKKRYNDYKSFAAATMDEIFPADRRDGAIRLKANMLHSCYLRNDGNGKFTMIPLPVEAQVSPLNGMLADDFDNDGNLDVLINGNDYGTDVSVGRYDALNGLLLKGRGDGEFAPLSILQSGIFIPGNGKALVNLTSAGGKYLVAASQYRGALKLFELKGEDSMVRINPGEVSALVRFKNGQTEKKEFYYGSSFLSQSARTILISKHVSGITIFDGKGGKRNLEFR